MGLVNEADPSKPFAKDQGTKNLKDHKPQGSAQTTFETKFRQERYPPIYTIVIQNLWENFVKILVEMYLKILSKKLKNKF